MKLTPSLTDEAVLAELGARLEAVRLARNLSQTELAAQSGVARKAIQRLESGEPITTTTLVRVLRALGLTDGLDQVAPEPLPSPVDMLKLRGRTRKRASGKRGRRRALDPDEPQSWRWGDQSPPGDG